MQLLKRARAEPEFTLIGGILRFPTMANAVREKLDHAVNVIDGANVQFVSALGAAILGHKRLEQLGTERATKDLESEAAHA